ncbi:uncharacterized protein LOC112577239 isoform X2 [Pomacea canaliculata]|uniref:uncharacterized protein LOC112577239 isoform X2 n=1 Tax=Pomacea canaliculata TaxID=400727 RepID=UPI000D729471|nr:uncharacterized protein LOC112577239 isoform X2 [Pomacea canaliculata]
MEEFSKNVLEPLRRPVPVGTLKKPRKLHRLKDGIKSEDDLRSQGNYANENNFRINTENNFCSGEAEKQLDINKNDVRGIVFNSLPRICQDNLNEKVGESEDSNLENSYFVDEWAAVVKHTAENTRGYYISPTCGTRAQLSNINRGGKDASYFQNVNAETKSLSPRNPDSKCNSLNQKPEIKFLKCELPMDDGQPESITIIGTNVQKLTETLSALQRNLCASLIRCDFGKDQLIIEVEELVGESLVCVRLAALPPKGQYSVETLLALSSCQLSKEKPRRWSTIAKKHPSCCLPEAENFFTASDIPRFLAWRTGH